MSDLAIKADKISKVYQIGSPLSGSFREGFGNLFNLFRNSDKENEFWALKDLTFELKMGEVLGVVGHNGAGKSTLLKILSRITEPTYGRIEINGRVGSLLEVGTGFHPELSGRENIFLNGSILGMRRNEIKAKFQEIVEFSGVGKFIDTPVKRYSSGMYVRLAFAVAAHMEPEILIIDEVLAVGDAEFQKKCLGKMQDVAAQGRTVLFVSHHMGMVRELCTNGILLKEGQVIFQGSALDTIDRYIHSSNYDGVENIHSFEINNDLKAQMLEIKLEKQGGDIASAFDVFDEIVFKAKYIIRERITGLSFNLIVERNGEPLFLTFDTDNSSELLEARKVGIYETECRFPCPLKAGKYVVHAGLGVLRVSSVHNKREAFVFDIEERSFNESMKSYGSSRIGVMATSINWKTNVNELIDPSRVI